MVTKVLLGILILATITTGVLFYILQFSTPKTPTKVAPNLQPTLTPEVVQVQGGNPFATDTTNPFATTSGTTNPFAVSPTKAQEYTNPFDALR